MGRFRRRTERNGAQKADSGSVEILDEDGEKWGRIRTLRGDIGASQVRARETGVQNLGRDK